MSEIFNRQHQKEIRQKLRKQPIIAENRLWNKLRHKQLGYKFRRQHGIGKYVVDFYCSQLNLVIEVDGATHSTSKEKQYDLKRQDYLERLGITVKRYCNSEIKESISWVIGDIFEACKKLDKTIKL